MPHKGVLFQYSIDRSSGFSGQSTYEDIATEAALTVTFYNQGRPHQGIKGIPECGPERVDYAPTIKADGVFAEHGSVQLSEGGSGAELEAIELRSLIKQDLSLGWSPGR